MGEHVLVARMDSLGDVLLAGPAIRAVAAGAGRVTLLAGPRGRAAAELLPGADEVISWCAPWIDPEPGPLTRAEADRLIDRIAALGGGSGVDPDFLPPVAVAVGDPVADGQSRLDRGDQ